MTIRRFAPRCGACREKAKAGFGQQQEFAKCFGVSVSTLSRWGDAAQVQQHFHDGLLAAVLRSAVPAAVLGESSWRDRLCGIGDGERPAESWCPNLAAAIRAGTGVKQVSFEN